MRIVIKKPSKVFLHRNNMAWSIHAWNAYQIKLAMQMLHKSLKAYIIAMIGSLPTIEFVKTDKVFAEKMHHWKTKGSPRLQVSDEVEAFKSMADGKYYTSRSGYREDLRGRGYEELGNERAAVDEIGQVDDAAYDKKLSEDIMRTVSEMA